MEDLIVQENNGILWATLNRAQKANSISRAVTDTYIAATQRLAAEPDLKGMIWTSCSETLFSGGVDLKKPEGFDEQQTSEWRTGIIVDLVNATLNCPRPIVTMSQGRMLGGAFLNALVCDRIVAAEGARFQLPEVKIGIGSPIAAAIVEGATNQGLAYDLLLSARDITAEELATKGGPCVTVPSCDHRQRAIEVLENYASMPSEAFAYMKQWFQTPRIAALNKAIQFTSETRKNKNQEVSEVVGRFFQNS